MASVSAVSAHEGRRLEKKVAIITGGASGIGETTARLFSKHGAHVVIGDIQDDLGHALSKELESAIYVHCDVTKEEDVENLVDTAVSKYGKLDIMFNNAGISNQVKPNILDNTAADFEKVLAVNLIGVFLGIKHAARVMIPVKKGSIIITASVTGCNGGSASHAYSSSKHGVIGLMKNTAVELGLHGIRVNSISPHAVLTPLLNEFFKISEEQFEGVYTNLKGSHLQTIDVAQAVLYLASDESKYVSGHNLIIDGGVLSSNLAFHVFGHGA